MPAVNMHMLATETTPIAVYEWHPATHNANQQAVILVPSAPWDAMRLSWLYRKLAVDLSERGFLVLRFDLAGSGDSPLPSSSIDWQRWQEELRQVSAYLRSSVRRLHLLGTRLGATLAWMTAASDEIRSLHLIDPVWSGSLYLQELAQMQEQALAEIRRYGSQVKAEGELFGFPLQGLAAVSDIDPEHFASAIRSLVLYRSDKPDPVGIPTDILERDFKTATCLTARHGIDWANASSVHFQAFCHALVEQILEQFEEVQ